MSRLPIVCLDKLDLHLYQRFPMDDSHDGANSSQPTFDS